MPDRDIREALGLRPVINVSGTMTSLGASIVVPEAIAAMTGILPQFVEINDLQRKVSPVIARLTGAEAGEAVGDRDVGNPVELVGRVYLRNPQSGGAFAPERPIRDLVIRVAEGDEIYCTGRSDRGQLRGDVLSGFAKADSELLSPMGRSNMR